MYNLLIKFAYSKKQHKYINLVGKIWKILIKVEVKAKF